MTMDALIATYDSAKQALDTLDEQIRTHRHNRERLQQLLSEAEDQLPGQQQMRLNDLLQGKSGTKSGNEVQRLTQFISDAKQAIEESEAQERQHYLALCDAQTHLDRLAKQISDRYWVLIEGKPRSAVEKGLVEALLPLANLVKAKGALYGALVPKQWATEIITSALEQSLANASGVFEGDIPQARQIIAKRHQSAFPDVLALGSTPIRRMRLQQGLPLAK